VFKLFLPLDCLDYNFDTPCSDHIKQRRQTSSWQNLTNAEIVFAENSKFLITEESKSENRVASKIFKVEPSSGNIQICGCVLLLMMMMMMMFANCIKKITFNQ